MNDDIYYRGALPKRQQFRVKRTGDVIPNILSVILLNLSRGNSVIDIGAGVGGYVRELRGKGYETTGVDATPKIAKISDGLVSRLDITNKKRCKRYYRIADCGLFLEVGEHIPKEYEQAMLDIVCSMVRDRLIVSWGEIGQKGYHHVNCRSQVYVACEFAKRGWYVNEEKTNEGRHFLNRSYQTRFMVLDNDK